MPPNMATATVEQREWKVVPAFSKLATYAIVIFALCALWQGYKWLWETTGWTWPFLVDDTTMPNLWDIFAAFGEPVTTGGPALIHPLLDAAWFTAKEAIAGFVLGAVIGFAIAVVLVHSRLLERGFLPYIVASQTVPILAIAPMVVIGLGSKGVGGWKGVATRGARPMFFPVGRNGVRGRAVLPRSCPGRSQRVAPPPVRDPPPLRRDGSARVEPVEHPLAPACP